MRVRAGFTSAGAASLVMHAISSAPAVTSAQPVFDLYLLLSRYMSNRFPHSATDCAMYCATLPVSEARVTFLAQLLASTGSRFLSDWFGSSSRSTGCLYAWLPSPTDAEAVLLRAVQQAQHEVRWRPTTCDCGCAVMLVFAGALA